MFLVKSCEKKYNVSQCKTLRIGTLLEYRETESSQIVDKEEGYFELFFDLNDKFIDIDLFNHLNNDHNSNFEANVETLAIGGTSGNSIHVTYHAYYNWSNRNRFIFCISKLDNHESSKTIFPDYDDYWFVSIFKKELFIKALENALFKEVKDKLANGEVIFNKYIEDISKLSIKSHYQEILYKDRDLYLDNDNIDAMHPELMEIFKNIKFIKPDSYKNEYEFRIVFDFYEENLLLNPIIKSIIIPDSISHLIQQP